MFNLPFSYTACTEHNPTNPSQSSAQFRPQPLSLKQSWSWWLYSLKPPHVRKEIARMKNRTARLVLTDMCN